MKKDIVIEIKGDIEKHISELMQKHFVKLNGELILMTGTIKMLAAAGETGKIIEICNLMLDEFGKAAEHSAQRTCAKSPYGTHQFMNNDPLALCVFCGASR